MAGSLSIAALRAAGAALAVFALAATSQEALAISIELKDVAPDRIERQRAAHDGRLPLAKTPDTSRLEQRLAKAGVQRGAPVFIRVFKETSELELWMKRGDTYVLFASYPVCHWSGTLGPKLREGDRQTPEGFYTVTRRQMHHIGRWPRSIDLGFPNTYDRTQKRDGSYILMHGGCSSVGCFAMTNPVIGEIYGLAQAAIRNGQRYLPVHVFPFRMTEENLAAYKKSPWASFWADLSRGYEAFERTRRPPKISVCKGTYVVEDAPVKQAGDVSRSGKGRKTNRGDLLLGAIRENCPAPKIAQAEASSGGRVADANGVPSAAQ